MRIKISKECEEIINKMKTVYDLPNDGLVARIAFSHSLMLGKKFNLESDILPPSDGREYRDEKALFGTLNGYANRVVYKCALDQHYEKNTHEDEFSKYFKFHLNDGLKMWKNSLEEVDIESGEHIKILLNWVKKGLSLRGNKINFSESHSELVLNEISHPVKFKLGKKEDNTDYEIKINDLSEFDNRNIAIAGMAGSGKTQLIKDVLFQLTGQTDGQLKFIFFDYKGEGNRSQLDSFLKATKCEFVDIVDDGGLDFNPLLSVSLDERKKPFSIKAFVDTVSTFIPNIGVSQKNILNNILLELFEEVEGRYPTVEELFESVDEFYKSNKKKPDTLYAGIQDLATNIFKCDPDNRSLFDRSIYLNLPPTLSDTLRQLIVFLLLRYFNSYFSSTNDCEPKDNIFPLRYVIVIDEAHIYLKNKNARKALEELLRLLRSKGVIVVMLSQGVEDYKTKDFDFASQVKLPICLNVQNKDYKAISSFVGTPKSQYKLETKIQKLDSGLGLLNLTEPEIIELRQFWKTEKKLISNHYSAN
jgi:DNA sulfur modification protein DndE